MASMRSAPATDVAVAQASPWETLYRQASPSQQADLLALAGQQGLLYSHQLPAPASSRNAAAAEEPPSWNLLGKLLAGQVSQLEPNRPQPLTCVDPHLDRSQQHAVAAALAAPEICLIQGAPGTGKSRVVLEILTQAALRGDRVLLVAAHAAALDRVLEQAADREALCPLRCIGPEENATQLPPAIRAWTLAERAAQLRQQSVTAAKQARQTAELQSARRRHEETIWPRLAELLAEEQAHRAGLTQAETRLAGVPAAVHREVDAATGSAVANDVSGWRKAQQQHLEQLANERTACTSQRDQETAKLAALDQEIAAVAPLADAKQRGQWWSGRWWRATFQGNVAARLAELQAQRQQAQAAAEAAAKRLEEIAADSASTTAQVEEKCQTRIQAEIAQRQKHLQTVVDELQAHWRRNEETWNDLCGQLDAVDLRPTARTPEALAASQERWQQQRRDDEAQSALLREWSDYLDSSADTLASRLPGYANVIAATPAALAADPHFSDAAASGGQFDLLIVDEADHLTESEFLKCARRARAWILVGEPALLADVRPATQEKPSGQRPFAPRGQYFHRLWDHLHCDPRQLPYAWFREGERLGCRLRQLAADQRQWLESEPLADAPDVELRILALPRTRPVLAEVLFPAAQEVAQAKEFLCRELQELTVQTRGSRLRWHETPEKFVLHFDPLFAAGADQSVALDQGICEILIAANKGKGGSAVAIHTTRLEFDRAAGWDRARAEQWLEQHLCLRDLGRTVWLDVPHRMAPALAPLIADLLFGDSHGLQTAVPPDSGQPALEFVAVPAPSKARAPAQGRGSDSRGPRRSETAPGGIPTTGSGLELDLAAPRHNDRLPSELRGTLPNRGFVNYLEARAVVRRLEELCRKPAGKNGDTAHAAPSVAVIALFPAQAELIRHLIKQSPALAHCAATLAVGVPATFRHREADVVVVSLTRSHTHRAVAYGEGPAALMLALTRAQRQLILVGDPGNLVRRCQWQGVLDHLDETAAHREGQILGQLARYLQGQGLCQQAFRFSEGTVA